MKLSRSRSPSILLQGVSKSFTQKSDRVVLFDELNLEFEGGTYTCVVGPNGCGKSTLLNIMSGIDSPDKGTVSLSESGNPAHPSIGFVFQDYNSALFPWLTNLDNIAFPLIASRMDVATARDRAKRLLADFHLSVPVDSYPGKSSGGQKQKIAIARALITSPQFLFLDEPTASLDFQSKIDLQNLLLQISNRLEITVVHVTHDPGEAAILGDVVLLLPESHECEIARLKNPVSRPRSVLGASQAEIDRFGSTIAASLVGNSQ